MRAIVCLMLLVGVFSIPLSDSNEVRHVNKRSYVRVIATNGTSNDDGKGKIVKVLMKKGNETRSLHVVYKKLGKRQRVNKESDGLERWRIIWIVVALVMSAGFAVVGAYFMYGCLKRRTLSSRSHRTDEVTARTDRSVGRSCDLEMELSEKIDRICKSLSQESVKSAERRQKSMTDIAANRAEKASKEAAAEKKSLSYFVKKMRSEFPELSDKTQRGSSSSGKKPRSSRNVKRKEETESREENAFRDDPLERSREESKEEAAEKSIDIKKESVVDSKTPTTFTETATATTQKSITTVLSMLPFASHDKTPRK